MPPPPPCKHFNSRRRDGTLLSNLPVQKMFHVKHFPVQTKNSRTGRQEKPPQPNQAAPDA